MKPRFSAIRVLMRGEVEWDGGRLRRFVAQTENNLPPETRPGGTHAFHSLVPSKSVAGTSGGYRRRSLSSQMREVCHVYLVRISRPFLATRSRSWFPRGDKPYVNLSLSLSLSALFHRVYTIPVAHQNVLKWWTVMTDDSIRSKAAVLAPIFADELQRKY